MAKRPGKSPANRVWKPLPLYDHQRCAVDAYKRGIRRFFLGWHRRAGKDTFALDFARERMQERVGSYWHLFPFQTQAKRAIWNGIDARTGDRFIDRAFPKSFVESTNNSDLSLVAKCGSTWQMLGSDYYDRMVGSNPCGVIFSEWALCDPAAWEFIRPILLENNGWVMFITTFRGRNHAFRMYEKIKDSLEWYSDIRTINDTHRIDGSPIITAADVKKEVAEGMNPALAQQEFYCNPQSASAGAVFLKQHTAISQRESIRVPRTNRSIDVCWGFKDAGIAAVATQGRNVLSVSRFGDDNITDAVTAIKRRFPQASIIHHAISPDPTLFSELDGEGVVAARIATDKHMVQGHAAAFMNVCEATAVAREALIDFTSRFAPFQAADNFDDENTGDMDNALTEALAIANSIKDYGIKSGRRLDYSRADRAVI